MYLEYYDFLENLLGEDVKKFANANEDDLKYLINTLKYTNLKDILDLSTLKDLCYKIVYSKYKKSFVYVLWLVGHIDLSNEIPMTYQRFIYYYLDFGHNNAKKYKEIFKFIESFFFAELSINYNDIINLVDSEMEYVSKNDEESKLFNAKDLIDLTEALIENKNEEQLNLAKK